jgi:hypothetical protein
MKRRHLIGLGVLGLLAVAQAIPVERSNPPVRSDLQAPADVSALLRRACYDCHSHETQWPWYASVAPASWFLAHHVEEGREEMNFSEWPVLDFEAQQHNLEDIEEQIAEGKMPLRSYTLLHPEARLDEQEKARLLQWARSGTE